MTEPTDREDVIPTRLGDLSDVDSGTAPAVGDALVWNGTEWASARGDSALLPEFGPAITAFTGSHSGVLADTAATATAWNAIAMTDDNGNAYPGPQPTLGTWGDVGYSAKTWIATEPGVYTASLNVECSVDGAFHATAIPGIRIPVSLIKAFVGQYGQAVAPIKNAGGSFYSALPPLTLFISQGMIDAGFGALAIAHPTYYTDGTERIVSMELKATIERHSPGSIFDYYGDL